jgi:3-hydroxyacyl-[acyl-carrier-protein] dehydratase
MRLEYFQLIDRIADLDLERRTIQAEARVPETSTIFEGHFPGFPLMPGVLLVEIMAQVSGWLIIGLTGFSRMPFLATINDAKLRSFVNPGTSLMAAATLTHDGSGFARTQAEIRKEGKVACNAELTFRVVGFPNPEFRSFMEQAASAIAFPVEMIPQNDPT